MDYSDGGCAPTPLQSLEAMQVERDFYREQVVRLKHQVNSAQFAADMHTLSHPPVMLDEVDTSGETWLTPYEGLVQEGVLPELGISVLVGSDIETGKRSVSYRVTGATEELGDLFAAIGAIECVKGRLGERVAA